MVECWYLPTQDLTFKVLLNFKLQIWKNFSKLAYSIDTTFISLVTLTFVIIELLLGGGFDDDNNDDQDGGMLIPAYSRTDVWIFWIFKLKTHKDFN